ncbi:MAG: HNH endonuclease [Nanobdellota archaeon]
MGDKNIEPLPLYKDMLYYGFILSGLSLILSLFFIIQKYPFNYYIYSIIFLGIFASITYFIYITRCPKCKRSFVKKEDDSKEKDLGIKKIKRNYTSEIYKNKDGEIVDKKTDYKLWPARFVQRFFYCKRCGYGINDEWHDAKEGVFKKWDENDKWNPPKPKIIKVKETEDGYVRLNNKKRIPIKSSIKQKIYARANNACQHCGEKDASDIHHIDGNPSNNRVNNLIVLCPTCHRKVGSITKTVLRNESVKAYNKTTYNIYKN